MRLQSRRECRRIDTPDARISGVSKTLTKSNKMVTNLTLHMSGIRTT